MVQVAAQQLARPCAQEGLPHRRLLHAAAASYDHRVADAGVGVEQFEAALDALLKALDELAADRDTVARRAEALRLQLRHDRTLSAIVGEEERPLIVELLRDASANLVEAFSQFQRAEARILHDEGLSMERIGSLFGVSRQRVADLLRRDRQAGTA